MRKIAAMTPAKARALEALAGLAVGGAAAGTVASKTYQTETPRYWLQNEQVYGRKLTGDEKKKLVKRMGSAAAIAGTAAAGLSLGASAIRRGRINSAELHAGREAFDRVFKHLESTNRKWSGTVSNRTGRVSAAEEALQAVRGVDRRGRPRASGDVHNVLTQSLAQERAALEDARTMLRSVGSLRGQHTPNRYQEMAKRTRDNRLWGGRKSVEVPVGDGTTTIKAPGTTTSEGQMHRVLKNLGYGKDFEISRDGKVQVKTPGIGFWEDLARRTS